MRPAVRWFQFALGLTSIVSPLRPQADIRRAAFDEAAASVRESARTAADQYRSIEERLKEVAEGSRKNSPFYLSIKDDVVRYQKAIKQMDRLAISIRDSHVKYKQHFSTGLIRSAEVLRPGEKGYDAAAPLNDFLNKSTAEFQQVVAPLSSLRDTLAAFITKMESVGREEATMAENAEQWRRRAGDVSKDLGEVRKEFGEFRRAVEGYSAAARGDTLLKAAEEKAARFRSRCDSLSSAANSLGDRTSGKAGAGEKNQIWKVYDGIVAESKALDQRLVAAEELAVFGVIRLRAAALILKRFGELMEKEGKELRDLAKAEESRAVEYKRDRSRFDSLGASRPFGFAEGDTPYRELSGAHAAYASRLDASKGHQGEAVGLHDSLIAKAEGVTIAADAEQAEVIFKELEDQFDRVIAVAEEEERAVKEAREAFRKTVTDHFLYTPEYWSLFYEVREEKSLLGDVTVEESSGYLVDPNAYPARPYHGRLLPTFQVRLRVQQERSEKSPKLQLVFEGTHPFRIEGMGIRSGDSLVCEVTGKATEKESEEESENGWRFVWSKKVTRKLLDRIVKDGGTVQILLQTASHRIDHTLYRKKLLKEVQLPPERLERWREMLSAKPA